MRISVALCTYNGERHLAALLESLVSQVRRPDEIVICDDRSSDATVEVLRAFAGRAPVPVRIHLNDVNLGSTKNFERAFGLCQGDVIFPCDQDDVWLSEKIVRMEAAFADPSVGLAICDAWLVGPELERRDGTIWRNLPFSRAMQSWFNRGEGPEMMLRYNLVTGAACAFRASLRDVLLPIPATWIHDGWIGFLASAIAEARIIPEPLLLYRQHVGQQIGIPRRTLAWQIRTAYQQRDRAHFERLAECFETLTERLRQHADQLRDRTLPERTAAKAAMARSQATMRDVGRFRRIGRALGHLAAGNYRRYNRGLKAFAVDAFLP